MGKMDVNVFFDLKEILLTQKTKTISYHEKLYLVACIYSHCVVW